MVFLENLSLLQNYCGADLLCCGSLKGSRFCAEALQRAGTYKPVRLAFLLACALHIGLLMTFCKSLIY